MLISYGSCLPQIRHYHIYHSCQIKIPTSPIFIGSSSNLIWGRFWGTDFKFQLKKWIKRQALTKKGIILSTLVKYSLNDGHHGKKKTSILRIYQSAIRKCCLSVIMCGLLEATRWLSYLALLQAKLIHGACASLVSEHKDVQVGITIKHCFRPESHNPFSLRTILWASFSDD